MLWMAIERVLRQKGNNNAVKGDRQDFLHGK